MRNCIKYSGVFLTLLFTTQVLASPLHLGLSFVNVYVASTGSDSNTYVQAQSISTPWATVQHALASNATTQAPTSGLVCGDTINVINDGVFVEGGANLPVFAGGCDKVTTIKSVALSQFLPAGYRTDPVRDGSYYGKISFTSQGINAQAEVHGNRTPTWNCTYDQPTVTITNPGVFTTQCAAGLPGGLANGDQVEFEQLTVNPFPVFLLPTPLVFQQKYYVVSCSISPSCGAQGGTYSVAATSGGTAINITACDANCQIRTMITKPVAVAIGTPCVFTSPDDLTIVANGIPVNLAVAGSQSYGTFPTTTPQITTDVSYYPVNVGVGGARNFQLATAPGGVGVACSTVGTGTLSIANANTPNKWRFQGLELAPVAGSNSPLGYLLQMGGGTELSVLGIPSNFEVDRLYMHGNDTVVLGQKQTLARCISENGIRIYVHDSYCSGATYSEAQGILGIQSQGSFYLNTFIEGATENYMCGGQDPSGGLPCQHQRFIGNYFYHPPTWKYTSASGAPVGACQYDTYDPLRAGGEWYLDTMASQLYQCGADFLWHTSSGTPQSTNISFKDEWEHKNERDKIAIGNVFRYSFVGGQDELINASSESNDSGPGAANDKIIFQNNAVYDTWKIATRSSRCLATIFMPCASPASGNHINQNNLFVLNPLVCGVVNVGGPTCGFLPNLDTWAQFNIGYPLQGFVWGSNTVWSPDNCCTTSGGLKKYAMYYGNQYGGGTFTIINNALYINNLNVGDFQGDASGAGASAIGNYFTNGTFTHNVQREGTSANYSVGGSNTWTNGSFPANLAAVKFKNGTGTPLGDYHLDPTSNFSAAGGCVTLCSTDGTDLGANMDVINTATSGAVAGTPTWDSKLIINPGSTKVLVQYTSPVSGACTFNIYNSLVPISANLVTSMADSNATAISDGYRREIPLSGLTSSTQYWYLLDCGGQVRIPGTFTTKATGSGSYPLWETSASTISLTHCTNKGMSTSCATQNSNTPLLVGSNTFLYWRQTTDSGQPSILVAR